MAKMAAWVGVRVDRITERWDRFADAVSARWDRSLDRIAIRWDRFAETVSAPYVRALDRIVDLWDRFAEAKERLTESFFVGWDRLSNRLRGRRVTVRSAGERPRRRVVGWILALALAAIVGVASLATLSALRGAGGERSAANADLMVAASHPDTTVDRPGGMEAAPGGATSCLRRIQHAGSEHSGHTGTNEPDTASPTRVAGRSRFPRGSPVSPMRRAKLSSRSAPHPAGRSTTSPSGSWASLPADTRRWILSCVTTQRRHEGSHRWSSAGGPPTPTGPPSTS